MSSMYGATGAGAGNKVPSGYKVGQLQQFTPEQMELFRSLFGHVGPSSYLSRLASGDQSLFGEMEAPAMRQFAGLQGNIASRFSGGGGGAGQMQLGGRHSSGFQNTMNEAASSFAQDLQSRRQELQMNAIKELFGMGESLLGQKPYEQFLYEKKKPFWQRLLGGEHGLFGGGGENIAAAGKLASLFI